MSMLKLKVVMVLKLVLRLKFVLMLKVVLTLMRKVVLMLMLMFELVLMWKFAFSRCVVVILVPRLLFCAWCDAIIPRRRSTQASETIPLYR